MATAIRSALIVLLVASFTPRQDETPAKWNNDVTGSLGETAACFKSGPLPGGVNCNVFVGRTLERLYGLSDLRTSSGRYLSANQAAAFLMTSDRWRSIGAASEQENLDDAANAARSVAVVAVWENPQATGPEDADHHGHIALIGPGDLQWSGTWGLRVPMAAAFSMDDANGRFIGDKLSRSFGASKKEAVMLYAKTDN